MRIQRKNRQSSPARKVRSASINLRGRLRPPFSIVHCSGLTPSAIVHFLLVV
jgi:hypothetical protein